MIGLVSSSSSLAATDALRTAIPLGIGLASAAYLTMKAVASSPNKSTPVASIRAGDKAHDQEYLDDQDKFLARCEEECGPVFRINFMNLDMTVVSGPLIREVFMNEDFSAVDTIEELTGLKTFFTCVIKSNKNDDNKAIHEIVRDNITPKLEFFTPRIVEELVRNLNDQVELLSTVVSDENEKETRILIEKPLCVTQEMVANAMARVFVGPEIAKSREVMEAFIGSTKDFARALGNGGPRSVTIWKKLYNKTAYSALNPRNPLTKHARALVNAAEPVVIERRRLEAEAIEKGIEYDRPDDILQKLLDNADKYGLVDLEDVCGHLLVLILASVHTTTDTSTNLLYYFAAFPQYIEQLYEERQQVLDLQQRTREEQRQELIRKKEAIPPELDPSHDRNMTAAAVKKMVHMDSFVREVFRYRTEKLLLPHHARKTIVLSDGTVIPKGHYAICNMRSAHYGFDQGEDPAEFRPWRFVGRSKAAIKAAPDFLTFGMGPHACPGRFLAIQELKTIGMLFVERFSKFEVQDPSLTKEIIRSRIGYLAPTGLYLTKRT